MTDPEPPAIVVCGLGPGGQACLTEATAEVLTGPEPVFLRTARHPSAPRAGTATSFDSLYEAAETFDEVYTTIAERIREAARQHGRVVYAVPGSPLVLERSVQYLLGSPDSSSGSASPGRVPDVDIEVLPALSFLDEVWARLRVDPVDDGVRLIDGHRFATEAADQRGPLLVAHTHAKWVLSDLKLALDAGPEQTAVVLQALGTPDEEVFEVAWPDLDRSFEPDHLTSIYLPEVVAPVGFQLARSVEMMTRLRRDCPWDQEQTHRSLRRYLVEEAYEVVDAIDRLDQDGYGDLEEELGDLLFQVLFHAELATEAGSFTLADVAQTLTDKMIHRHPHVYGDGGSGDVARDWEGLKAETKHRGSAMDDIPRSLPGLSFTDKMLKRAERAGRDPELGDVRETIENALPAHPTDSDVGVLLVAVVAQARRHEIDAEQALRDVVSASMERFRTDELAAAPSARWVLG